MRLTRVYVDAALGNGAMLELPAGAARHVGGVLRLAAGAALRVFNGQGGEHDAVVESSRRGQVSLRIGTHHAIECESPLRITLLQGIARGEKMDLILQKATELGVTRVLPVSMARSNLRLDAAAAGRRQAHWRAVIASACEQCGRNTLPGLEPIHSFGDCLEADTSILRLLLAPAEGAGTLPQLVQNTAGGNGIPPVSLLVGPEGGFDAQELALAAARGFLPCRMGPRILRTETAALAALAALQSLAGDHR